MLKKLSAVLLITFLVGCNDKPYTEPVALKLEEYNFNGMTEVGTPICGATISAYKFSKLSKGEKIGEAVSGPDGGYNLKLRTDYDGPVLLAAQGGIYRDLTKDETIALKPGQELRSVITHIKMPEKTNINAWTTLAVARTQADRGFWDKAVAELKDIDRLNVDFSHFSYFLSGKSPNYVNIIRQEAFDAGKDSFKLDDPRVALHLAHGGLSKLASDFSARLAEEGINISVIDLVTALADDLSDRIFDGRNAAGNVVFVGNNRRIGLDSYTMRKKLSEAILLYSNLLESAGKMSASDKSDLEKPGKLVHLINWQTQPELFPQAEAPKPLDKEAPMLHVNFASPHSREAPFAYLKGEIFFEVEVEDESFIKELKMLEPKNVKPGLGNKFGPISIDQIPQGRVAAKACAQEAELDDHIKKFGVNEANVVCACFEAVDSMGNAKKELICFQRPELKTNIELPKANTIWGAKNFADGAQVKAFVSSGLPLTECSWQIKADVGGEAEDGVWPSGSGNIDGTFCTITETIDGKNLFNGRYYLEITAKDVAGRIVSESGDKRLLQKGYFEVVKDPPEVEIVRPLANDYVHTSFVEIVGTVKKPDLIDSIEYKIRGIEEKNEGSKASSRAIVDKNTGNWDGSIGQNMSSGRYSLDLVVTDIYGNQRALERREFTLDFEAPTIMGAKEGVSQKPYLQETMAYNQRFIDEVENPRYVVEPSGSALPMSWSKKPIIQRWSTRIDDNRTAPVYAVKVRDDNKLKEVRYSIAAECAGLSEDLRVATEKDERYEFPLIQSLADADLSQDSAHDVRQKYCLSIWAIDQAGHASNHTIEFGWKVITPPVSVDMNTTHYRANRSDDDITSVNKTYSSMFVEGDPLKLFGNVVVGHSVITNPHSTSIFPSFDLKKPIYLQLNSHRYYINQNKIKIKYFSYDLATGKVGREVELISGKTMLKSSQAVLAKFILQSDFIFKYPGKREKNFWKDLSVEIGFNKTENSQVDGLLLSMLDASSGRTLSEFMVPWGESHYVRKRIASRFIK